MELGLLNYINVDLKWNIVKKGRRSVTRRPRKPGADSSGAGINPTSFDAKKSGTDVLGGHFLEKVVDAPLKKRRLLHQSPSPSPQTLSPEPQTPSFHREDSGRCHSNSVSLTRKTKSKSGSRNGKKTKKEVSKVCDFSGIELLAAAACSTFLNDNVEDFPVLKEQTTPGVKNSCSVDMKETIGSTAGSLNRDEMVPDTPILHDNGNEEGQKKKTAPSKGLRLHWDLNTVMDEWEEPSEDVYNGGLNGGNSNLEVEPRSPQLLGKHDADLSVMPVVEKSNGDSCGKTYESIEDLGCSNELMGMKKITSKTSDGESSASKSDVVDSAIHSDNSTTSVLREETVVKCESDTVIDDHLEHSDHKDTIPKSDQQPVSEEVTQDGCPSPKLCTRYSNKVASEDPVSECCGSDVTQDEQGHMAEGDTKDKVQVGYDSPFEDGELREPIGWEENEIVNKMTVFYGTDNVYKNDHGTIENYLPEKPETGDRPLLVKEAVHKNGIEISERKNRDSESRPIRANSSHIDELTSIDGCRNGAYIRHNRSSNIGDSYSRSVRDFGPCTDSSTRLFDSKSCHEYHRPRNVIGEPIVRSGGCRSLDSHQFRNYDPRGAYRRESPSERNNGYNISRGPPVRSHSRDRYRVGSGFHPQGPRRAPEEEYHERKIKTRHFSPNFNRPGRRSRSRSRSGSPPIAWHFQKRRNLDSDEDAGFQKPSNSSEMEGLDDRRLMDKRQSLIRRKQRFESIGYPERLKPDDDLRFGQRSGSFSQRAIGPVREHKYDKMKRVGGRCDDR